MMMWTDHPDELERQCIEMQRYMLKLERQNAWLRIGIRLPAVLAIINLTVLIALLTEVLR